MGEQTFVGESVFSGVSTYVRIDADPVKMTIDYDVGAALRRPTYAAVSYGVISL